MKSPIITILAALGLLAAPAFTTGYFAVSQAVPGNNVDTMSPPFTPPAPPDFYEPTPQPAPEPQRNPEQPEQPETGEHCYQCADHQSRYRKPGTGGTGRRIIV